jgi:hypothetical protein
LASRITFFEQFKVVMNPNADVAAKVSGLISPDWIDLAAEKGLCSSECRSALRDKHVALIRFRLEDVRVPPSWQSSDPDCHVRIVEGLQDVLPGGLPSGEHASVVAALEHVTLFLDMSESGGLFVKKSSLTEKELQGLLRNHLRSRGVNVTEGTEVAGGETDLILPGNVVVENKVRGEMADPYVQQQFGYQARRYAISLVKSVAFVVLAYKPSSEAALLPLPDRIRVLPIARGFAEIRFLVPWGLSVPSKAGK